jgi:hypothetical protein
MLSELATDLLADLEQRPPDVEGALVRIRTLLTSKQSRRGGLPLSGN